MAIVFLVAVLGLFWYIFRGMGDDQNPIWGNIIASGINLVVCSLLTIWLIQGNIVQIYMVANDTHTIDLINMSAGDIANISGSVTEPVIQLDSAGAGMYEMTAVEEDDLGTYSNLSLMKYYHHNIVYIQIQDVALGFFFAFLAVISGCLFGWFVIKAREAVQLQKEDDDAADSGMGHQ